MTTLATESWSATSTTAWPSQWAVGVAQGTASVASSRGRLTPDRAGYRVVRRTLAGLGGSTARRRITGTFTLSNVGEALLYLSARENVGATDYYPNGYYVRVRPETNAWKIGAGYGTGIYGPASDDSIAGVALTFTAGSTYGFTVDVNGFAVSARLWNITAGQTEPTSWQSTWTDTDSAFPSGVPALAHTSGNTNTSYVEFGPVTVTDGADGAQYTSTGSASGAGSSSSGTNVRRGTSAAAATGTGSATSTNRLTASSSGAASGDGSQSATAVLAGTSAGSAPADGTSAATTTLTAATPADASGSGSATADTNLATSTTGTAAGQGGASASSLLRTDAAASATGTGATAAPASARLTASGAATGEGTAAATTDAPGSSAGDAAGIGSGSASTTLAGRSTAAATAYSSAAALTVLAARAMGGATATGTATATTAARLTTAAAATGSGTATATTTVRDQDHALDVETALTATARSGELTTATDATLSFTTRGGTVG